MVLCIALLHIFRFLSTVYQKYILFQISRVYTILIRVAVTWKPHLETSNVSKQESTQ